MLFLLSLLFQDRIQDNTGHLLMFPKYPLIYVSFSVFLFFMAWIKNKEFCLTRWMNYFVENQSVYFIMCLY